MPKKDKEKTNQKKYSIQNIIKIYYEIFNAKIILMFLDGWGGGIFGIKLHHQLLAELNNKLWRLIVVYFQMESNHQTIKYDLFKYIRLWVLILNWMIMIENIFKFSTK